MTSLAIIGLVGAGLLLLATKKGEPAGVKEDMAAGGMVVTLAVAGLQSGTTAGITNAILAIRSKVRTSFMAGVLEQVLRAGQAPISPIQPGATNQTSLAVEIIRLHIKSPQARSFYAVPFDKAGLGIAAQRILWS